MGKLIGKLIFGVLVFPPLYILIRFLKWSWQSFQKEMNKSPEP